jgi:hypothetical protein
VAYLRTPSEHYLLLFKHCGLQRQCPHSSLSCKKRSGKSWSWAKFTFEDLRVLNDVLLLVNQIEIKIFCNWNSLLQKGVKIFIPLFLVSLWPLQIQKSDAYFFFSFFFYFYFYLDRVSLCSPDWPWAHNPIASALQVLELEHVSLHPAWWCTLCKVLASNRSNHLSISWVLNLITFCRT